MERRGRAGGRAGGEEKRGIHNFVLFKEPLKLSKITTTTTPRMIDASDSTASSNGMLHWTDHNWNIVSSSNTV